MGLTRTGWLETRNRLHIYRRACCTKCGPRYQPLSRAPFSCRDILRIHVGFIELARCRSDLFNASSISRLARKRSFVSDGGGRSDGLRCYRSGRSCSSADMAGVIAFIFSHDGPKDPGVLVGQCHNGFLPATALAQSLRPLRDGVIVVLASQHDSLGPLYEQGTQVVVATLGDAPQTCFAAAGILSGREP